MENSPNNPSQNEKLPQVKQELLQTIVRLGLRGEEDAALIIFDGCSDEELIALKKKLEVATVPELELAEFLFLRADFESRYQKTGFPGAVEPKE